MKNDNDLQGLLLAVYSMILYLQFSSPISCLGIETVYYCSYKVLSV